MEKIKVNKEALIKALEENKIKHLEDYAKALEGYKIAAKKALAKKAKQLKDLSVDNIDKFDMNFFSIVKPERHSDDFNTVIGMLKISTDVEVYITAQEYKQYYLNEWSWAHNWLVSNSMNFTMAENTPSSKYYVDGKVN